MQEPVIGGGHVLVGDHQIGEIIGGRVVSDGHAPHIIQCISRSALLALREGKHHIVLAAVLNAVIHVAGGRHSAAVDRNAHVGVDAGIPADGAGCGGDSAAVDDQPAVGIDAVALAGTAVHPDIQAAAVDGGDGHAVLVGVDAVVSREDIDIAAVDGQVQLTVQSLVLREDVQNAGACRSPVHIHGHFGVKGAIIFVELFAVRHGCPILVEHHAVRLVDAGHIGAGDVIRRAVGDDDIGAGGGGIHLFHGGLRVGGAALIDVVEDDGGRHGAGDVRAV